MLAYILLITLLGQSVSSWPAGPGPIASMTRVVRFLITDCRYNLTQLVINVIS